MKAQKTIPERSAETTRLLEELRGVDPGAVITYKRIKRILKADPQADGYGLMTSARRIARKQYGLLFECVPTQGLKRMTSEDIVHAGPGWVDGIRRKTTRAREKLALAHDSELSREQVIRKLALGDILGAIALEAEPRRAAERERAVSTDFARLSAVGVMSEELPERAAAAR